MRLLLVLLIACAHEQHATVDLAFRDAPIHDVLRAIATSAHVNLDVDPDVTGTVSIDVHGAPWRDVLEQIARDHHARVDHAGNVWHVTRADAPATPTFTGTPIAVDFADTPIRDAMAAIAERAHVHIVVADDVQAAVTLRLRNAPYDLALDHLARKYNLHVARDGDTIRVTQ